MLLLHDAHVLSPCFTLGLFASQRRQTAENSQENYELQGAGDVGFNKLQQRDTLTWDQSSHASTKQSNSIPTLPSVITPTAQWHGKYLVMDKIRQD